MIGLTDAQLDMVRMAAAKVPHAWRSRFLSAVVDQLTTADDISDYHVHAAISLVLKRIGVVTA